MSNRLNDRWEYFSVWFVVKQLPRRVSNEKSVSVPFISTSLSIFTFSTLTGKTLRRSSLSLKRSHFSAISDENDARKLKRMSSQFDWSAAIFSLVSVNNPIKQIIVWNWVQFDHHGIDRALGKFLWRKDSMAQVPSSFFLRWRLTDWRHYFRSSFGRQSLYLKRELTLRKCSSWLVLVSLKAASSL